MKLAILLLCHKNSNQINLLLKALEHPAIDFFIHVDKKSTIKNDILHRKDVYILDDDMSVDVRWGEISQLQATLNLFKAAFSMKYYDNYWLCSGQDFPIVSNDVIVEFFEKHKKNNFISFWDSYHINGKENHCDKRNSVKFPHFLMGRTLFRRLIKRAYIGFSGGYNHTFNIFRRKDRFSNVKFYYGPSWIALSNEFTKWMFNYIEFNPWILAGYETSLNPDESFFQTLLMMSPYKDTQHDYLHYIDWSERPGKPRNSPNTLTMADYDKMKSSGYLMGRKFDMNADKDIIYKLMKDN